jgi:hypothetical protein
VIHAVWEITSGKMAQGTVLRASFDDYSGSPEMDQFQERTLAFNPEKESLSRRNMRMQPSSTGLLTREERCCDPGGKSWFSVWRSKKTLLRQLVFKILG